MNDGDFLLSIIKKLDVEEGDWEKLYSNLEDNSILYKYTPSDSKKGYLFYWSNQEPMSQIEEVDNLVDNEIELSIVPQDTYLILFTRIEALKEKQYKKIIEVEENEFRYKKYVCYYTEEELIEMKNKIEEGFVIDKDFLRDNSHFIDEKLFAFIYRMIIKVPIIKMNFEQKELEEFQSLYEIEKESEKKYQPDELNEMEQKVFSVIPDKLNSDLVATDIVDNLISDIYGDDLNEYLS
ncbi:ABC-three component system middle component 1 [Enterococcus sp. AZ163]|uniref:ABC-three component system middle component 1 n=1 Tax=Enterococcus sp. AZ163 TaxID=2774638 RepID=UPI003D2D0EFF